ncbi:MAG TPA: MG2 domain-containing protein, partial [Solirubrobacterales bacterium]|nr:MG2 domain-containing protein [Solirubrobacterales bacterium]
MRHRKVGAVLAIGVLGAGMGLLVAGGIDAPSAEVPGPKHAVDAATPPLPAEVVAALQEGRFGAAITALEGLDAKAKADERAYYAWIRGIALRLDGKGERARAVLREALAASPKGRWAAKLRGELAAAELAAGRPAEAETLARAEAEALLDDGRKDRLAGIYQGFAARLLQPDDPTKAADPEGAYALLTQARELAKGAARRAAIRFAMAKASQRGGNHPRAIQDLRAYLAEFPDGADRDAVRLALGASQLAVGQALPARLTWTDLARDLETKDTAAARSIRAAAVYLIPKTFGIPSPPDDARLNLGVAALRRALATFPSDPRAVRAAYEIGQSYLARGKQQEALDAFRAFLKGEDSKAEADEARGDKAELAMAATFQVAQILQQQGKFDEAIAADRGYLAQFPDGPQSADAQRAILDAQLAIAADFERHERYEKARAAWRSFAAQNPLDPRVPQVLFQVGQSFLAEKKYGEAIAAWEALANKFPGTEPAGHAQFQVAEAFEAEKGDPAAAIERYKKIAVEPWRSQALQRVAAMVSRSLAVVTPRTFRSGEAPTLEIRTRNLDTLTFTAYKLDAESYFRKKQAVGGVEALDIGLVAPDAEWTAEVPKYAKYRPIESDYELKVKTPGVYVVKVTDEKTLQATTLVVGSDVDAILKTSREQLLVYAQDMKTGKGRANARVLVSDGSKVIVEGKTGADGVLLSSWDPARDPGSGLSFLVLDGRDATGTGLAVPGQVAQGLGARAYLSTDRPAYRPGHTVELRGVVREVKDGQYAIVGSPPYRLEVSDSRGRRFVEKPVSLSRFGTFHETLPLDSGAPVGDYRIRLYRPGGSEFAGGFAVQAYQLQKADLTFDLPQTVYYRGETIQGAVVASYQGGMPLARRPIRVALPDGRVRDGTTDAAGRFAFEVATTGFAEEGPLGFVAQLPEDGVAARSAVMLAVRAFAIRLDTDRDVYLDGETFALRVTTTDAKGDPTGQALTARVLKRIQRPFGLVESEVQRHEVTTDPKTGKATLRLTVEDADGGSFVVRVAGNDRLGNPVVADRELTVSGRKDAIRLRLLADRTSFKVGEEASVSLHNRAGAGPALLAWEADKILKYKVVDLNEGANRVAWEVDSTQFPNFTLTAARMAGTELHEARLDLRIERDLRISVVPTKESVGPGDEVEVEVRATDQLGRPVAAEVALALVDRALLRLYNDTLPPIGEFFYNQARTGAFATSSTIAFRYAPPTVPVPDAVVEEDARQAAEKADETKLAEVTKDAQMGVPMSAPAPAEAGAIRDGAFMFRAGKPAGTAQGYGMGGGAMGRRAGDNRAEAKTDATGVESDRLGLMGDVADGLPDDDFDAADKKKAGAKSESRPTRRRFVETAYWNPSVVTDKQGKARVTFKAPTALSRYRFTARGATGADTLVGQATADLTVRQDFYVDLKTPASLTQGDRPRFSAKVHHRGVKGRVDLRLTIEALGREVVLPGAVEVQEDGVDEVYFEPFDVPDGDALRITLAARAGDEADQLTESVPIRPWGVEAIASAAGTSSDDTTAFVSLPQGRAYRDQDMQIVLAPTFRRLLMEIALGREPYPLRRIIPVPPNTTADRASDLLAACAALSYLKKGQAPDAPEAGRLTDRIRGLVAELVTSQNDDGGWPWVVGGPNKASDRMTSARAFWAMAEAETLGLATDAGVLDRGGNWLAQAFAAAGNDAGDLETRATLLHALSARGKATFEQANGLGRVRQRLNNVSLAYLALTFANLDRNELAGEALAVLAPRAKAEPAGPGTRPRRYWDDDGEQPWHRSRVETTALAALAFARARPEAEPLAGAIDWLNAHRVGNGWRPHKAKGPALAAVAAYQGDARRAEDRYRLTVTVNDEEVFKSEVLGTTDGKAVRVPRRVLKPSNRIRFDIEGRGTFGYSVTLTGFTSDFEADQDRHDRRFTVDRRVYRAEPPSLDGKTLPSGFGVAVDAQAFENRITQLSLGGRTTISLECSRHDPQPQRPWERDFLVLQEYLPAGTTLVEGSVHSSATHSTYGDGVLTLYFAPDQWPGCTYQVFGHLPGQYRALPPQLSSAYEPGRYHLGPEGKLTVLMPGEKATDPYRATPDELFARGKATFDAGKVAEAAAPLEELAKGYTLRPDIAKDVYRMLLAANIQLERPRQIVDAFEVLKEKAPEYVIPFDQIRAIGRAYASIGEAERAYLVWKVIVEASYVEDARLGEVLRRRGQDLEGLALLLDLWREYPDSAAIRADFFALSQLAASLATRAATEPTIRRELAAAGLTRPELLAQSIRLVQAFLAGAPKDPLADEASLALVGAFLELEDYRSVVKLARRFAELYPRSTFLDSFQYSEALGRFHLGEYDRAVEVAEAIARATYKDANGVEQPSPNKWQALYILGQIYDARRRPARALSYYEQVADRFTDAAGAIKAFKREALELPEVTVLRPAKGPAVAAEGAGAGFRAVPVDKPDDSAGKPGVTLSYRNIAEADVKVYPVDLVRLYLTRRNLDAIAGIDLAGITPLVEAKIELGDGKDYDDKSRTIALPLKDEGAYLVMVRGDSRYASGVVLVSPLELEVLEEPEAGRVRLAVRDARTKDPVPEVRVKAIGSNDSHFFAGTTDLRGVFVAEGVHGVVTAVARQGTHRYAFYRGKQFVGTPP